MKKPIVGIIGIGTFIVVLIFLLPNLNQKPKKALQTVPVPSSSQQQKKVRNLMKISSSAFENNQNIPSKYTCQGENVNLPLSFSEVPSNAKSLVLIMDDPDAPMGTWDHWVVFNIPEDVRSVAENSVPQNAVEGVTSFGKPGYGGPCPPSGTHRYFFKLYALDTDLTLSSSAIKAEVEKAMEGHLLDKSELIGLYSRSK